MAGEDPLMAHSSNGNPFDLLQTIPIPPESPQDSRYAVPKPRASGKTKRSRARNTKKRSSAPSQSLAQGIRTATNRLNASSGPARRSPRSPRSPHASSPAGTDDLLGLFGDDPPRPALTNARSQPSPNANPFDFFDPLSASADGGIFANVGHGSTLSTPSRSAPGSKRSSIASSVGSSNGTEELFNPDMWDLGSDDFFEQEAEKASAQQGLIMPGFQEDRDEDGDTTESDEEDDGRRKHDHDHDRDGSSGEVEDTKESSPKEPEDPPSNALIEMHRGTALLKYPRRHGFPHFKHVQLSRDNRRIQWFSKRKSLDDTCIHIADVREIRMGQKTETFQKFHQEVLEKASFSVVFGDNYRTFDVVAKSTDECNLWVRSLRKLSEMIAQGEDVSAMPFLDVGITFKDRNRPKSRDGSGNFVRANNSRQLKIDPVAMKQIERDMDSLRRSYTRITNLSNRPNISLSNEYENISQVLSELEERIEELSHEVLNTRDTDMSKRDVWRANVDLAAIGEKVEVLLKVYDGYGMRK